MEKGLRECLKSVRMGHILIHNEKEGAKGGGPQLFYAHLPHNIQDSRVLLLDPVLGDVSAWFFERDVLFCLPGRRPSSVLYRVKHHEALWGQPRARAGLDINSCSFSQALARR